MVTVQPGLHVGEGDDRKCDENHCGGCPSKSQGLPTAVGCCPAGRRFDHLLVTAADATHSAVSRRLMMRTTATDRAP
jgi:hypothetical protein